MTTRNGGASREAPRLRAVKRDNRRQEPAESETTMKIMELTAQEIDRAVAEINAIVREPYRCENGDFPWLDEANLDNWMQALEQENEVEIPSFYAISGRTERIRRTFIERRPEPDFDAFSDGRGDFEQTGGAA